MWPAVHDPLADTDTETESVQSVKVAETDENNVEKDTPVAMAGLDNEEKQEDRDRGHHGNWKTFTELWTPSLLKDRRKLHYRKTVAELWTRSWVKRSSAPVIRVSHSSLRP